MYRTREVKGFCMVKDTVVASISAWRHQDVTISPSSNIRGVYALLPICSLPVMSFAAMLVFYVPQEFSSRC